MKATTFVLLRGLVIDLLFLAGLILYGWGLWRQYPDYAPIVIGVTLMLLGAVAQCLNRRSANAS